MFDTALVPTGAAEFGFTLFDSIEAALCCGGDTLAVDTLAVDAVLMVGPNDFSLDPRSFWLSSLIELFVFWQWSHVASHGV